MKKLFFLLLAFSLSACASQKTVIAPQGEVSSPDFYSWDFGKVKQGVILEHTFMFKNESKANLNIKGVDTSCGCTASEVKKKNLLPNEETAIEVKFNTRDYNGAVQQFIYVHSDNPENPVTRFIIKADVIKGGS